ncbi:MAG: SusD/RagB family nutrient-binding outer membrane lipoprotein [Ferruginibacter sp.]
MINKFKYIIPIALFCILGNSCTKNKYNINVDPTSPSTLPVNILLPTIEANLGDANEGGIQGTLEVYMHRIVVRESANDYGAGPTDVAGMWNTYYRSLFTNADIIIAKATADGNFKYAGITKIIKAFAFSQLVDVWGDIPYTEATKFIQGIKNPKFDDDATIYPKLFALIDDGISNLSNTAINPLSPGTDDVIYGGSVTKWINCANTIKLDMYLHERKVKNVSADVTALLASGKLIGSTAESFNLPHSSINKTPGYGEYSATQKTQYISPWFYETMKGYNDSIFKSNPDPRIPYYFYNQVKAGQTATNDNNATEYRDGSFISIYFGTNGINSGFSQQKTLTTEGIYPVGGLYDDGAGQTLSAASASGSVPFRIITYADRLFMEAELINTTVISGDARAKLLAAITESFKQVDYVVTASGNVAPPLASTTAVTTYIAKVMAEYDAGNTAKQLRIIMTQKWIQSFYGNSVDTYSDYRRTGYPVIFNPSDPVMAPGGMVQPPIGGNPLVIPQLKVPVSLSVPFPISFYWPAGELSSNSNAPAQKIPSSYKVFWQP